MIVIASTNDDKHDWIEAGRLYERLALTLTACRVKTAFLNQPIEDAALRSQLQTYLHMGTTQPQSLLQFGYADAMPRSLRRPIEQVLVSRFRRITWDDAGVKSRLPVRRDCGLRTKECR